MKCLKGIMTAVLIVTMTLMLTGQALAWRGQHGRGEGMKQADSVRGTNVSAAYCETIVENLPYEDLSEEEEAGLIRMREEEKLARDVYLVLYDKWGHRVFGNIARSEQRHTDAIKVLLDKYSLTDPSSDNTVGVFTSSEIRDIFDTLTEKGSASLAEALQVGATIEDLDIFDLKEFLAQTDNSDIRTVYQNLLKGSRNHLRAFMYQISAYGESYDAQYLSSEDVDAIINSPRERGQYDENGKPAYGRGRGSSDRGSGFRGGHGGRGSGNGVCPWAQTVPSVTDDTE